eukprot:UN26595
MSLLCDLIALLHCSNKGNQSRASDEIPSSSTNAFLSAARSWFLNLLRRNKST